MLVKRYWLKNVGGCGNLFVFACSGRWAWHVELIVLCIGVQRSTVVVGVEYLGCGLWIK